MAMNKQATEMNVDDTNDTLMRMEVFLSCLQMIEKWNGKGMNEMENRKIMEKSPRELVPRRVKLFDAYGPFAMPFSVDGVWFHQPLLVTDNENFKEGLILGRRYIQRKDLVGLVDEKGIVQ